MILNHKQKIDDENRLLKIKSLLDFFIGIFKIKTFMIKNEKI